MTAGWAAVRGWRLEQENRSSGFESPHRPVDSRSRQESSASRDRAPGPRVQSLVSPRPVATPRSALPRSSGPGGSRGSIAAVPERRSGALLASPHPAAIQTDRGPSFAAAFRRESRPWPGPRERERERSPGSRPRSRKRGPTGQPGLPQNTCTPSRFGLERLQHSCSSGVFSGCELECRMALSGSPGSTSRQSIQPGRPTANSAQESASGDRLTDCGT